MSITAIAIMAFVIGLITLFGVLIKHFKCYWLISGYNTASEEKKKNVDIEGLGIFMGNFCFIIAGVLLVGTVLNYLHLFIGSAIVLGSLLPIIAYLMIKAQKYDHNTQTADGKTKKSIIFLIVGSFSIIMILVGGMLFYGSLEPEVLIHPDKISIEGMYGIQIPTEDITELTLQDNLPQILRKTNGFDLGNILKGSFRLEDLGEARLYINRREGPHIFIRTEEKVIILNFKDKVKTEETYNSLKTSWQITALN